MQTLEAPIWIVMAIMPPAFVVVAVRQRCACRHCIGATASARPRACDPDPRPSDSPEPLSYRCCWVDCRSRSPCSPASLLYFVLNGADPSIVGLEHVSGSSTRASWSRSPSSSSPPICSAAAGPPTTLVKRGRPRVRPAGRRAGAGHDGGDHRVLRHRRLQRRHRHRHRTGDDPEARRGRLPATLRGRTWSRPAAGSASWCRPSVPLIIYATVAEISVGDVFVAAIGPGLMLGLLFCVFIMVFGGRARRRPPRTESDEPAGLIVAAARFRC